MFDGTVKDIASLYFNRLLSVGVIPGVIVIVINPPALDGTVAKLSDVMMRNVRLARWRVC